ncbi:hypothetical protein [Streptomyces sp. NPDC096934]|uniref:hypothetical protein n=1 Tax=Streptomyces sp. NPDC096934 TaxID=3155551 RepID=UPI003323AD92
MDGVTTEARAVLRHGVRSRNSSPRTGADFRTGVLGRFRTSWSGAAPTIPEA